MKLWTTSKILIATHVTPVFDRRVPSVELNAGQAEVLAVLSQDVNPMSCASNPPCSSGYQLSIGDNHRARFETKTDLREHAYGEPLRFAPGTGWSHGNTKPPAAGADR